MARPPVWQDTVLAMLAQHPETWMDAREVMKRCKFPELQNACDTLRVLHQRDRVMRASIENPTRVQGSPKTVFVYRHKAAGRPFVPLQSPPPAPRREGSDAAARIPSAKPAPASPPPRRDLSAPTRSPDAGRRPESGVTPAPSTGLRTGPSTGMADEVETIRTEQEAAHGPDRRPDRPLAAGGSGPSRPARPDEAGHPAGDPLRGSAGTAAPLPTPPSHRTDAARVGDLRAAAPDGTLSILLWDDGDGAPAVVLDRISRDATDAYLILTPAECRRLIGVLQAVEGLAA